MANDDKEGAARALVAASVGNALEWYDFGLYGYLALTLQALFFPTMSAISGLLSIFLVFAVGLFARPLGGLLFGYIGDKFGRRDALISSMIMIAIGTLFIGLLPTYSQVGKLAPVLLICVRLLQGLSLGGEMLGSMTFLSEYALQRRRGLTSSLIYSVGTAGGLLGALSGALLHLLFAEETILAWAWRLPFLLGIAVGAIGIYIRFNIAETPLFAKLIAEGKTAQLPFSEAWAKHHKEILIIFCLISFQSVGFYLLFVYLSTWLTREAHFTAGDSLLINSVGMALLILFIPLVAALSDRIGRRRIMMAGALCTALAAYPLFKTLAIVEGSSFQTVALALFSIGLFALFTALFQGPLAATLAELSTTKHRYTTLALGYTPSAAIFGGLTPYLSTLLIEKTKIVEAPCLLLIATSVVAFCTVLLCFKETFRTPLT